VGAHTAAAHLTEEQLTFLQTVVPPALDSARAFDLPACIIVAQAILESAGRVNGEWQWGGSPLFVHAHNPFAIKYAHRQGEPYGEYTCHAVEMAGGKPVETLAEFQLFENLKQAFNAHAALLLGARYRPAIAVRHDWRKFAEELMMCGYSTDRPPLCQIPGCPHYSGKLIALVERYHLDDPQTLEGYAKGKAPVPQITQITQVTGKG